MKTENEYTTVRLKRSLVNRIGKEIDVGENYEDYIELLYEHYKKCKAVSQ